MALELRLDNLQQDDFSSLSTLLSSVTVSNSNSL